MTKVVQIKSIILDAGTQIRTSLDSGHVADLTEAYGRGDSVPPIDVFQTFAGGLILADGFHRAEAAKSIGEILATIHKGEQEDALRFALKANSAHGLKRSNADKRRAVEIAIAKWPEMSARAIADLCGVGDALVRAVKPDAPQAQVRESRTSKDENAPNSQEKSSGPPAKRVTGKDGKSYPASKSPPPPKPAKSSSKSPPPPKARLDKVGKVIPPAVLPLWDRAEEFWAVIHPLSVIRGILQKAQDESELAFVEVSFSSVKGNLDQAFVELKTVKPHAVCPTCQGLNVKKCAMCKGRGFVSKFYWDTCVSKEAKEMQCK